MIIVTGGAGFIGSNLIRGLNRMGEDNILVVDNLAQADKHRNLNTLKIADFIDKRDFLEALPRLGPIETIFHQGACSSTTETDGRYMMDNNYQYSKALLDYALAQKIDFLYASSASVYGDGSQGFREKPTCEYPLNIYAYSKFLFDNYVRRISAQQDLESQVLGLRYFNVYGPQERHKGSMASVMYHFFHQSQQQQLIRPFEGSEDFKRDFVWIDDVVQVNLFFYRTKKSGIYNCGTGTARSFMDIARLLQGLERATQLAYAPFPDHLKGKYQTYTEADLSELRQAGYRAPFTTLEMGVTAYHSYLKHHEGLYPNIVIEPPVERPVSVGPKPPSKPNDG